MCHHDAEHLAGQLAPGPREPAPYALDDAVRPFHYNLRWNLNFDRLDFLGEVLVGVTVRRDTSKVVLHASDLRVPSVDAVWIAPLRAEEALLREAEIVEALETGAYTRLPLDPAHLHADNEVPSEEERRLCALAGVEDDPFAAITGNVPGRFLLPDLERKRVPTALKFDSDLETLELEFAEPLLAGQLMLLRIKFLGQLNDDMVGLYRCTYVDAEGKKRSSACTQFEPTDARKAAPMWDEPNIKATFDVTVAAPKHFAILGNMPEACVQTILPRKDDGEAEAKQADDEDGGVPNPAEALAWHPGQKVVRFQTLARMSTYLVAIVVGEYDYISTRVQNRIDLRVWGPIGKVHLCRFALRVASRALLLYERYFGIEYPLPKLDLIGIPDFGAGAMENQGLITFRSQRLLLDSDNSSPEAQAAAARVICHELAHAWFGNYTTMNSWKQLWLNEAFARLTEFFGVDHVFPEWSIWTQFVESVYATALSLDGLASTHAVEVEVRTPAEINEIFDAISYAKGASVLRMVRGWIGEENFMLGIQGYLRAHPYRNAVSSDLWHALGAASNRPELGRVMQQWILAPGYPVVSFELEKEPVAAPDCQDPDAEPLAEALAQGKLRIRVVQRHFLSSGGKGQPAPSDTVWSVPLTFGGPGLPAGGFHSLLEQREEVIEIPVRAEGEAGGLRLGVLANLHRHGYYRVLYKGRLWEALLQLVAQGHLSNVDLIGLASDTLALMNANLLPVREFFRFARLVFAAEPARGRSIEAILKCGGGLLGLLETHKEHPQRPELLKFLVNLCQPIFEQYLAEPPTARLEQRLFCFALGALAESAYQPAVQYALEHFHGKQTVPAWIRGTVYKLAVKFGGRPEYDEVRRRIAVEDNDAEERQRLLSVIGATRIPELQLETIRWARTPEKQEGAAVVRTSELIYVLAGIGANDSGAQLAWKEISEDWEAWFAQAGKTGPLFGHCVGSTLTGFNREEQAQAVEAFFQAHPCDQVNRVVAQKLERIRERVFRRETQGDQLGEAVAALLL